jgi:citrate lyase acyl carrier protein
VLDNIGVDDVRISIIDKGALDCTIKARVEGAIFRSLGRTEELPWGGAIK